jgi:hypothetical protein
MNKWLIAAALLFLVSCKSKKEEDANAAFFPVASYIKSQVAQVDTTLNRIMKIITVNGASDTAYINRAEFRKEAKDFLSLPDISSKKLRDDYTETQLYDEDLERVILNYTPKNQNTEIRRQEVMIKPDNLRGDKVESIFIDQLLEFNDRAVQKRLTWNVDHNFQVVTIVQKRNTPDKIHTLRLLWNENSSSE